MSLSNAYLDSFKLAIIDCLFNEFVNEKILKLVKILIKLKWKKNNVK